MFSFDKPFGAKDDERVEVELFEMIKGGGGGGILEGSLCHCSWHLLQPWLIRQGIPPWEYTDPNFLYVETTRNGQKRLVLVGRSKRVGCSYHQP
jgi:hypothetical protein